MYKYSVEIPVEKQYCIVFNTWLNKEVYRGIHCSKYIQSNNIYQYNYSMLKVKSIKVIEWIEDIRYYIGEIPLDDWRLCNIPNKRRNAKLLTS